MKLLLLSATILSVFLPAPQKPVDPEVNRIEAYCADIEAMMSRSMSSARIFMDVSRNQGKEPERWREFASENEREVASSQLKFPSTAYMAVKNGRPVAADFMFEGDPSRWTVGYCFREDGTLARTQAAITIDSRDISLGRMQFFDTTGKVIFEVNEYYDRYRQQQRTRPVDLAEPPIHIYRNIKELPFYSLLKVL